MVGWPESVHDAWVLSNSAIYKQGNEGKLFPTDLVDPAYPLLPSPVTGFPMKGVLCRKQRVFNYHLSRAQMTVENTFGKWKGRFIRFIRRVDMEVQKLGYYCLSVMHFT
jgi:hypothetical protein